MTSGPRPIPAVYEAGDDCDPGAAPANGVSFVVPVFNKAGPLPAVLAAIAAQEGDFPREYIFIDDGSTDDSLEVLRRETADWPHVTIQSQPNGGSAAATNAGIARARMPFIKFVDADDLLARDATRRLLAALMADDGAVLAYGNRRFFTPDETPDLSPATSDPAMTRLDDPVHAAMRNSLFNPTQFLTRTRAARACGGCDERVVFSQEYSLTMRLARFGAFLKLDHTLAFLLEDDVNRLSNNKGRQLQRVTKALRYFVADYPDLPAHLRRFACRRAAGRTWRYARRDLRQGFFTRWLALYLRGRLNLWSDPVAFIEACEAVYDTSPPLEHGGHLSTAR